MNKTVSLLFLLLTSVSVFGQKITFGVDYWQPLIFGGYTQVREWDYIGQKYYLNEDLGMNRYESLEFFVGVPLSEKHELKLKLARYYFQGSQLLTENGYYNGTEVMANTIATIDASRYIRIMLTDNYILRKKENCKLDLVYGISLDAIRFLVDAPISDTSPRKETFEQFDNQLVPVPVVGLEWQRGSEDGTIFNVGINGGAWPGIDTWYQENGTIKIWQYSLNVDAGITKKFGGVVTELKVNYRSIYIKGESDEDTNVIKIHGIGPEFRLSYLF